MGRNAPAVNAIIIQSILFITGVFMKLFHSIVKSCFKLEAGNVINFYFVFAADFHPARLPMLAQCFYYSSEKIL
jgi:hypothetical protein